VWPTPQDLQGLEVDGPLQTVLGVKLRLMEPSRSPCGNGTANGKGSKGRQRERDTRTVALDT
jgi:hypothetical protein